MNYFKEIMLTISVFQGVILIKKAGDGSKKIKGCWDSIHVVEVQEKSRSARYKLTSTAMLWLQTNKTGSGTMNLGGSLTRQVRLTTCFICNLDDIKILCSNFDREIYFCTTNIISVL